MQNNSKVRHWEAGENSSEISKKRGLNYRSLWGAGGPWKTGAIEVLGVDEITPRKRLMKRRYPETRNSGPRSEKSLWKLRGRRRPRRSRVPSIQKGDAVEARRAEKRPPALAAGKWPSQQRQSNSLAWAEARLQATDGLPTLGVGSKLSKC